MQILNVGSSSGSLQELLQGKNQLQKENLPEAALEESGGNEVLNRAMRAAQAKRVKNTPDGSNMMSRNFAASEGKDTKYLDAVRVGLQTGRDMGNRQNSILSAGMAALNAVDADDYAQRNLMGMQAARRMREEQETTVREESERNLEENRKRIEEKAQDAMAPTDAEGNPLPDANPAGEIKAEAAPIELAGGGGEAATAIPAGGSGAPELAEAQATASAPTTPQVDIVV